MKKHYVLTFIALLVMQLSPGQPDLYENPTNSASLTSEVIQQPNIEGFKMYPNPVTSGYLTIITKKNFAKDISIYDVLGKQVLKTQLTNNNTLNLAELSSGVYLLKVTEENTTITRKLVIR
ncbi:T9SS type A sorting domain-containing protein [Leptobacterium sp. I13]|uniref:T9SS type A sorting domain-containing protein n=1 Tax=Leptobacterium meishanense TaxID=3128904 RepID=UPI0030EE19DB